MARPEINNEDMTRLLIGARKLTENDMKEVAERTRYALRTLQDEILSHAREVEATMLEMQGRHHMWRTTEGEWRFIVTPMVIGAGLVLAAAILVFTITPRPIQTPVEIQALAQAQQDLLHRLKKFE